LAINKSTHNAFHVNELMCKAYNLLELMLHNFSSVCVCVCMWLESISFLAIYY